MNRPETTGAETIQREMPNFRQDKRTDDQERNAMRAFLQRTEVRLSTIHRVAVGFISGAGLLFLLPVFLKDAILALVRVLLDYTPAIDVSAGGWPMIGVIAVYLCVIFPFVLSLLIPIMAMGLLLRDIVQFYFVGHTPGFPEELFNPRFVLTGVAFSPDESEVAKNKIMIAQYGTDNINFVLPFSEEGASYYGAVIDKPKRMIVPRSRRLPRLIQRGVLENLSRKPLDKLEDDDPIRVRDAFTGPGEVISVLDSHRDRTLKQIDRFNAALGLAGFIERPLFEEVAKQEVSLVRHALRLRQMVLRYFQALIVLLWTALYSFTILPFLQDERGRFPTLIVFGTGYLIWAILTPIVVRLPVNWLAEHSPEDTRQENLQRLRQSDGIRRFEQLTERLCYLAALTSVAALILEVVLRLR